MFSININVIRGSNIGFTLVSKYSSTGKYEYDINFVIIIKYIILIIINIY